MNRRRFPLSLKLWGVFAGLTLVVFALLAVFLPWLLRGFFTDQIYDMLVDSQSNMQLRVSASVPLDVAGELGRLSTNAVPAEPADVGETSSRIEINVRPSVSISSGIVVAGTEDRVIRVSPDDRTIRISPGDAPTTSAAPVIHHFVLEPSASADPIVAAIERNAEAQEAPVQQYTLNVEDRHLFYVVRKETVDEKTNYIVSYAWGNYRNDLVRGMYGRLLLLMIGIIVASWLPCLLLARYLTRPLVEMERHVGRLAERDWHEPLPAHASRTDEIGRLARAIETMRERLVRQDEAQQFYLHNVSHELKTPVMVIRSYAQSIRDGIFPKGDLEGSLGVIMKEAERLERRVRDLLLLNKLTYFASRNGASKREGAPSQAKPEPFSLAPIVRETIERLRVRRPGVVWDVNVDPRAMLSGDVEQWGIAFENLLDNQIRYARSKIRLDAEPASGGVCRVRIANDGPPLEGGAEERLFEPFASGAGGQFGLGLAIVRQIAANHGMSVRAANEEEGAAFYLEPADARRKAG